MTSKLTLACSAALLAFAAACGGSAPSATAPTNPAPTTAPATPDATAAAAGLKAPGEAKIGDKTTCPVSKETFTVTDKSPKAEYKGKTYYFCCGGCDGKFKADPDKYLTPGS